MFIAIQAYLKKETNKNQINNLTLHLKKLEKEEMKNPTFSRRKEIIKIRAEINEKETKETVTVFVDRDLGTGSMRRRTQGTQVLSETRVLYLQKCMLIYLQ